MYKNLLFLCSVSIFFISLLFIADNGVAASVKDRMASRIPAINSLKDQGAVGENNKGYLEFRSGKKPQKQLVVDENKDRKLVYTAIAKKQKVTPQLVGKRRATMIADKGKTGHWFQKTDGSWYKK